MEQAVHENHRATKDGSLEKDNHLCCIICSRPYTKLKCSYLSSPSASDSMPNMDKYGKAQESSTAQDTKKSANILGGKPIKFLLLKVIILLWSRWFR